MINFNAEKETTNIIYWIRNWFEKYSGNAEGVVVGISGGKDSSIVASLCAHAIGPKKVYGVLMPQGEQKDINDSIELCNFLGIDYRIVNIEPIVNSLITAIRYSTEYKDNAQDSFFPLAPHTQTNIPPRIRMTILYAIAQEKKYRVAGTGNWSESYIGYFTKWGDGACDFNPIRDYTVSELLKIGDYLKLPYHLVHKIPADGLCGKTDEENLGFSYSEVDDFKDKLHCENIKNWNKIVQKHDYALHKLNPIPYFDRNKLMFY